MKRIAILGANSFLARNYLKYCSINKYEYEFILYDIPVSSNQKSQWKEIDFDEKENVHEIDFNVDALMVFIGKTGTLTGFDDYETFIRANEICLLQILDEYVKRQSNALILYPSSRLIFQSDEKNHVTEDSSKECRSIYAVTKLAAENYLRIYRNCYGLNYVALRICTPIGTLVDGRGSYGTFEIFESQAKEEGVVKVFGDGLQRKTFTSIHDVCKAFCLLIDSETPAHNEYNLGGQELSLIEIAESIARRHSATVQHVKWPEKAGLVDGGTVVFDSTRFDIEFNMQYTRIID